MSCFSLRHFIPGYLYYENIIHEDSLDCVEFSIQFSTNHDCSLHWNQKKMTSQHIVKCCNFVVKVHVLFFKWCHQLKHYFYFLTKMFIKTKTLIKFVKSEDKTLWYIVHIYWLVFCVKKEIFTMEIIYMVCIFFWPFKIFSDVPSFYFNICFYCKFYKLSYCTFHFINFIILCILSIVCNVLFQLWI